MVNTILFWLAAGATQAKTKLLKLLSVKANRQLFQPVFG